MATIIMIVGILGSLATWMFFIRPYVISHGRGVRSAAGFDIIIWADWHNCGEIATDKDDRIGRIIYRVFGVFQLVAVVGFLSQFI